MKYFRKHHDYSKHSLLLSSLVFVSYFHHVLNFHPHVDKIRSRYSSILLKRRKGLHKPSTFYQNLTVGQLFMELSLYFGSRIVECWQCSAMAVLLLYTGG